MKEVNDISSLPFLKLQSKGIVKYARLSEIVYIKADDNYTCFVLNDSTKFIMCRSLQTYETSIGSLFFRCHKSFLINLSYVKAINKRSSQILLSNGEALPYSRSKIKFLEERMQTMAMTL